MWSPLWFYMPHLFVKFTLNTLSSSDTDNLVHESNKVCSGIQPKVVRAGIVPSTNAGIDWHSSVFDKAIKNGKIKPNPQFIVSSLNESPTYHPIYICFPIWYIHTVTKFFQLPETIVLQYKYYRYLILNYKF